jgi:hypothetical protein
MPILLSTKAAPGMIPRRPSQQNFNAMLRTRQNDLNALIDQLAKGELTPREWADAFDEVLLNGHTQAWAMGRQRAGDLYPMKPSDQMVGIIAKDAEAPFLQGFMQDIIDGRYRDDEGEWKIGQIKQRASLYVGKMRGTASEAWVKAGPQDEPIKWVMLALEHCTDCPEMAALSPWEPGDLWAYPGSGDTECLGNCKCVLRRESGAESFRHPSTPADAPDIPLSDVNNAA